MFHDSGYETVKSESVFFASMSVNAEPEKWFFSIIDIVAVLTESIDATENTYKATPYKVLKTYFLPKGMF